MSRRRKKDHQTIAFEPISWQAAAYELKFISVLVSAVCAALFLWVFLQSFCRCLRRFCGCFGARMARSMRQCEMACDPPNSSRENPKESFQALHLPGMKVAAAAAPHKLQIFFWDSIRFGGADYPSLLSPFHLSKKMGVGEKCICQGRTPWWLCPASAGFCAISIAGMK